MREECIEILKAYISKALIKHASNSSYNIFDGLVELMQTNWDASPRTMSELRLAKKTKDKGDLLEHFAYLYFKYVYKINKQRPTKVYLLKDVPETVLTELNLKRHDLGIDLILVYDPVLCKGVSQKAKTYCAVQVKYRQPNPYKQTYGVSWSDLSTFYALVNRSGPYRKHIILTNAHYVRHIGKKEFKDQSICIGTLRNISLEGWMSMADLPQHSICTEISSSSRSEFTRSDLTRNMETSIEKHVIDPISKTKTNMDVDHNTINDLKLEVEVYDKPVIKMSRLPIIKPSIKPRIRIKESCPNNLEELRDRRCDYYDRFLFKSGS